MNLNVNDFVFIKYACYGYSPTSHMDVGPFLVRIKSFNRDSFIFEHFLRIEKNGHSKSTGTAFVSDIVLKMHPKDIAAYLGHVS